MQRQIRAHAARRGGGGEGREDGECCARIWASQSHLINLGYRSSLRDAPVAAAMIQRTRIISSRMRERDSLLFVYGTLRPFAAIPMSRWLSTVAVHVGHARTPGRLYDLGPYPGLTLPRRRGEWVLGEVYRLRAPKASLRVLDRYEAGASGRGEPRYVRMLRTIEGVDGGISVAWLYVYRRSILQRTRIEHGDYRRYVESVDAET